MSTKSIRLFPFLLKLKLSGDRTEKSSSSLFLMIELEEKYYSGAHLADDHCFRYYCGTTNQNVAACIQGFYESEIWNGQCGDGSSLFHDVLDFSWDRGNLVSGG